MEYYRVVLLIGYLEIIAGATTLIATLGAWALHLSTKPLHVLLFVIAGAVASILLGIGILRLNKIAYRLFFYFIAVIIINKVLLLLNIIHFEGALLTIIPETLKNCASIVYHLAVLYFLQQEDVKKIYCDIPF